MHVVFLDESGYTRNWTTSISEQPFYVLSAVCIPLANLSSLYATVANEISDLSLPEQPHPMGRGFEIKATDIARGRGWWGKNNVAREAVRSLMLGEPRRAGGAAIVTVIDKQRHFEKYMNPIEPHRLALKYVLERIQILLEEADSQALCIYDQNHRVEDTLSDDTTRLVRDGSPVQYVDLFGDVREEELDLSRILEFAVGRSQNSTGLQIADFFAGLTYQYYRKGQPTPCAWWDALVGTLYAKDGRVDGIGLKVFPGPEEDEM